MKMNKSLSFLKYLSNTDNFFPHVFVPCSISISLKIIKE